MPTDEEAAIRDRLAKLAAQGRHAEREAVAWQLADLADAALKRTAAVLCGAAARGSI